MLFTTPQFFAFLAVVLIAFYCSPRSWRRIILLAASYFFYMSWIPKFILLLLALTVIDYTAARWIARTESPRSHARAISGISRSIAQSPPPMTFPARAVAIAGD